MINVNKDYIEELRRFARENGIECPELAYRTVMSELWDMVLERIIGPEWLGPEPQSFCIRGFRLTEYGEQLLQGLPIDRPSEYIDYLKSQVPNIDPRIIIYVRESLHSYNLGCYFAASVMLGVASETLFELLIDAYTNLSRAQMLRNSLSKERSAGESTSNTTNSRKNFQTSSEAMVLRRKTDPQRRGSDKSLNMP